MTPNRHAALTLSARDREQLRVWSRKADSAIPSAICDGLAKRAKALFMLVKGPDYRLKTIAKKTGLSAATVMRIRDRAIERGIGSLPEGLAHGRRIDHRIRVNLRAEWAMRHETQGEHEATTTRLLAAKFRVSQSTASRWIRERRVG